MLIVMGMQTSLSIGIKPRRIKMDKNDLKFVRQMWWLIGFFTGMLFACTLAYFMGLG